MGTELASSHLSHLEKIYSLVKPTLKFSSYMAVTAVRTPITIKGVNLMHHFTTKVWKLTSFKSFVRYLREAIHTPYTHLSVILVISLKMFYTSWKFGSFTIKQLLLPQTLFFFIFRARQCHNSQREPLSKSLGPMCQAWYISYTALGTLQWSRYCGLSTHEQTEAQSGAGTRPTFSSERWHSGLRES